MRVRVRWNLMPEESLNSNHARRLSLTCRHIDKLLADMESALSVASSKRAFPEYLSDVAPAQRRVIEDYIARIRTYLAGVLDAQGIGRPQPFIPVTRSLHIGLTSMKIAAEELQPRYMRGYGQVSPAAATDLNRIASELVDLTTELDHIVTGENREQAEAVGEEPSKTERNTTT